MVLAPVMANATEVWTDPGYTADWSSIWNWGQSNDQSSNQGSQYIEQWAETPAVDTPSSDYNPCVEKNLDSVKGGFATTAIKSPILWMLTEIQL